MKINELLENFLKMHRDVPVKISELNKIFSKKIKEDDLQKELKYLENSGKIINGSKGVQWIYDSQNHLKYMLKGSLVIA